MTTHTPTPWLVDDDPDCANDVVIPSDKFPGAYELLATAYPMDPDKTRELANANAAFIVRAVNAHEELMKALKATLDSFLHAQAILIADGKWNAGDRPVEKTARAALAKAKG